MLVHLNFSQSLWTGKLPVVKEAWQLFKIIMPKMASVMLTLPFSIPDTFIVRLLWSRHCRGHLAYVISFPKRRFCCSKSPDVVGSWPLGEGQGPSLSGRSVSIKCRVSLAGEKVAAFILPSLFSQEASHTKPGHGTELCLWAAPIWAVVLLKFPVFKALC